MAGAAAHLRSVSKHGYLHSFDDGVERRKVTELVGMLPALKWLGLDG
jgi:hypothetical protein